MERLRYHANIGLWIRKWMYGIRQGKCGKMYFYYTNFFHKINCTSSISTHNGRHDGAGFLRSKPKKIINATIIMIIFSKLILF